MKVVDTLPYMTNMCSETNSFVINVLNINSVSQYVDTDLFSKCMYVCMYVCTGSIFCNYRNTCSVVNDFPAFQHVDITYQIEI